MSQLMCVIKTSPEYQNLQKRSGIQDSDLEPQVRIFLSEHNRYPYTDEVRGSDSSKSLAKELNLNENNATNKKNLLDYLRVGTIKDATAKLNNMFRDLDIKITALKESAIVKFAKKPTKYDQIPNQKMYIGNISNIVAFNDILDKMINYYGINVHHIGLSDLTQENFPGLDEDSKNISAFVYNGDIYINSELASVDSQLHELGHILVGNLRFYNPKLYQNLVSLAEQLPNYDELIQKFPNRTRNDVNEEIFIEELSKHLVGQKSSLSELSDNQKYEISYEIKRLLDSLLMGSNSVNSIPDNILFNMSLRDVANLVNSSLFSVDMSNRRDQQHRKLANLKSELLKQGKIKEYC